MSPPAIAETPGPTAIWLDCDTGHDDAFAILLAARNPDVRLLGISTVYGNASLDHTTYNTRAILEAIARTDVPVYAGSSRPFSREPCYAPGIHGQSGLDGTACLPEPTVPAKDDACAVEAMYRALSAQPEGKAWLVATGALTNIAKLFMQSPGLADHIAGLSIMGGAVGDKFTSAPMGKLKGEGERFGNHTPYAEFNIYCDPEAAEALFANPRLAKKTTLIPLDLTHQFLATNEVQIGLLGFAGKMRGMPTMESVSITRRLFFEIVTFFARTYSDVFGLTAGPPTHDPLAVAVVFRPELFHFNAQGVGAGSSDGQKAQRRERFEVQVVTDGEHGTANSESTSQCGRTLVKLLPPGSEGITIPRGLEAKDLWGMIEACLSHTERAITKAASESSRSDAARDSTSAVNLTQKQLEQEGEGGGGMSDLARFARDMSSSRQSPPSPPSPSNHGGASKRKRGGSGGSAGQPYRDMASLVHGPNTTLSEFEMEAGTFPDIKGQEADNGGAFLSTNKEESLGQSPVEPTKRKKGHQLDADPNDMGSGGAKRNG
ncbi:hypothetical protein LTR36_009553 [Oleoguttula mirabilis]|uniref:Inosine/uridine-preferring nucleoside hydrolase domain-containing protein n=1 Tax=Oleoguttula mirabilis TaxID=1507867 RepID=A0AAV9JT11_9PEZI|nr:hypothetical protein LTR36_009553 [Oleoguttula mirabilis]